MNNFNFYNPTHIVFGKNRLAELDKMVPAKAKVLILFGGGSVKKFGTLDKVKDSLGNREVFEFGGIEPNPRFSTLMKAVEMVKEHNIDFLLAVGGGSVMDGTKFVSLASCFEGNAETLLYNGFNPPAVGRAIPLGTVVTLPATGSEMNMGAVISHGPSKYPVMSPLTFPVFSFLDPELTFTLPETQVANGVADAFVHVMEQYLTYSVDGRFQDRTSEGIMQTLIEVGRYTIDNPNDYDARANLVWNATMALNGLIGAGVPSDWATHMLGHELTAMYGIDHGKTLSIILPVMMDVRRDKKRDKLVQYAERVWHITEGSNDEKIDAAIEKTRSFFESLGIKTRLSEYGVDTSKVEEIIPLLEQKGLTKLSETQDLTLDISLEILKKAI